MLRVSDAIGFPPLRESESSPSENPVEVVKYGELIILGYNGFIPPRKNRSRRRSKFKLYMKQKISPLSLSGNNCNVHLVESGRNQTVIMGYTEDRHTDMFQFGRASNMFNDFLVGINHRKEKTVSRYACRIVADRSNSCIVRVYAGGFDCSRTIFLSNSAAILQDGTEMDGLTTNGVYINHPTSSFCGGDGIPGRWQEVSVRGRIFEMRESRSATDRGNVSKSGSNVLQDGTVIDLCGTTLLWRSAEGLAKSLTKQDLKSLMNGLDIAYSIEGPSCPDGLGLLVFPHLVGKNNRDHLYVYLNCGHVRGHQIWHQKNDYKHRKCPGCLEIGPVVALRMGMEHAIYVDIRPLQDIGPTFAFNPCGHMATEKTVKYWATVPIPHGTGSFTALCPFCVTPLSGYPGYVRLIFEDKVTSVYT